MELLKYSKTEELYQYIITNYNTKNIAHVFAIILRANYELENMYHAKKIIPFKLEQMKNFLIEYNNGYVIILSNAKKIILKPTDISNLVEYIYDYFNKKYPINYDYRLIDPIYFSLFFYDLLDKIIDIKFDTINISQIRLLRYKAKPVKLEESERYKALLDENYQMYSPFKSNLAIETPNQRIKKILKSVKNNGYAYNNQYAIFYNDEPYIRDGQHRVCALKYLNGNIDIKILRIYLKNNYFYE